MNRPVLRGLTFIRKKARGNFRGDKSGIFLAGAILLLLSLLVSVAQGTPLEGSNPQELTLEQAGDKAVENNYELKEARLMTDQAELLLENLEEAEEELDKQISEWEDEGVDEELLEPLKMLHETLEQQVREAEDTLAEGEETLEILEEMIRLGAESTFTALLILEETGELQELAHSNSQEALEKEKLRLEEGYSSGMEVEEARSRVRESEQGLDNMKIQEIQLRDELCMLMGEKPGTDFKLVEFSPEDKDLKKTEQIDLEEAVEKAKEGQVVEMRKERLEELEEDIGEPDDEMEEYLLEQAELEYLQAKDQARAQVREAYYSLWAAERDKHRALEALNEGRLQEKAMEAQLKAGYVTPVEAAAGTLARLGSEAEEYSTRYGHYLAYRQFELARDGYFMEDGAGAMGAGETPGEEGLPGMPGMSNDLGDPGSGGMPADSFGEPGENGT